MFWDGHADSEAQQRVLNTAHMLMPATNREREELVAVHGNDLIRFHLVFIAIGIAGAVIIATGF